MKKDILERIIELVKDDEDLHQAILNWINADAQAKRELALWRRRR